MPSASPPSRTRGSGWREAMMRIPRNRSDAAACSSRMRPNSADRGSPWAISAPSRGGRAGTERQSVHVAGLLHRGGVNGREIRGALRAPVRLDVDHGVDGYPDHRGNPGRVGHVLVGFVGAGHGARCQHVLPVGSGDDDREDPVPDARHEAVQAGGPVGRPWRTARIPLLQMRVDDPRDHTIQRRHDTYPATAFDTAAYDGGS